MRLRLPELLEQAGLTTYALVKRSRGRISRSTAYRLVRNKGRAGYFDSRVLDALCDVLGVEPSELLAREGRTSQGKRRDGSGSAP